MRHLQATTVVEHLAGVAAAASASATATPPPASVHTDTFLILAAVLCFLLCVLGLAFVARCSRMCNPSSYSVDADDEEADAAMPAEARRKGVDKDALEKLPTVPFEGGQDDGEERPECAICLAEFARGDEVRVLPPCGHAFHAACVDTWLLCTSTCPSCRTALALVVAPQQEEPADPSSTTLQCCASEGQASAGPAAEYPAVTLAAVVVVERGPCRTSVP